MKKALLLYLLVLSFFTVDAQSTSKGKTIWMRPYAEAGLSFPGSDVLKARYQTSSTFHLGAGLRFGDAQTETIIPYIQYQQTVFSRNFPAPNNQTSDSTLRIKEYSIGMNIVALRAGDNFLKGKVGIHRSYINDAVMKNNGNGFGVQVGIGYEMKLGRRQRLFIEYMFSYNKLDRGSFKDYDTRKLLFGFAL
jgi:hypothetical protein